MPLLLAAQGWPENYGGVMLQGFYWDSYSDTKWTNLERQAGELSRYFDLIWVPQSGWCGSTNSMGYNDIWWYDQHSAFGSEAELKSMIKAYKDRGTGIIADVVINHRGGATRWTDFPTETNPLDGKTYSMGLSDICNTDEYNRDAGAAAERAQYGRATGAADTGDDFNGCRDLDHTSANVQENCKAYTRYLLDYLGYAGFRYDMVKGYGAQYVGMYNAYSHPTYSVGEYWDGKSRIASWINGTKQDGAIQSGAFDFPQKYLMTNNATNYGAWFSYSDALATDGTYKRYAVTFVDNHDTYRDEYGSNNKFKGDVVAANAWIMALPGTPCVFLPHWQQYKQEIATMIKIRKAVGVTNTSAISLKQKSTAYLVAEVKGTKGNLLAVIGDDANSQVTSYIGANYSTYKKVAGVKGSYAYYTDAAVTGFYVDKASGTYDNSVDVTITPIEGTTVVYTTDGSEPTADNGKRLTAATTLTFTATTTLKAGVLNGAAVSDIEEYAYTVKAFQPHDITVYVHCPEWNPLYFYAWDTKPILGNWPGTLATKTVEQGGLTWYYQSFTITASDYVVNFIFNNGNGKPQTVDITGINTDRWFTLGMAENGKYNVNDVTNRYSGIAQPVVGTPAQQGPATVYSIDGRALYRLSPVEKVSDALEKLPHGLYIVNGRKIVR